MALIAWRDTPTRIPNPSCDQSHSARKTVKERFGWEEMGSRLMGENYAYTGYHQSSEVYGPDNQRGNE